MNSVNITQMNYIPMNNHNQNYNNNQNPKIQPLLGNLDDSKNFIFKLFFILIIY